MMRATDRQDWQNYIAERDELFFTSSTVSVSEMATTLAHEINQPLGAVSNILNGMQMRLNSGQVDVEQYKDALELALQQTQYAARVISRIRDFTQSRQPEFVQFNVVDLLNHSVRLLDWVFSADAIRVVLSRAASCNSNDQYSNATDPSQFVATGDYTMIQQVFTNLLRNAADALREKGGTNKSIRITVGRVRDGIQVDIKDNGNGLDGVHPDALFTPFKTTKQGGMGVGLSICHSFIELHQGRLWLSENEDQGCTAHVLLRTPISGEACE